MKAFLLVFDSSKISRELVSKQLNKMSEIGQWYSPFENTFCLASEQDAKYLAARLRQDAIPNIRFMITEVETGKKGGWFPNVIWEFLDHPTPVESSAA